MNELVIRVQPDEAIYLKINNKVPGLGMRLDRSTLNLHYAARYINRLQSVHSLEITLDYIMRTYITLIMFLLITRLLVALKSFCYL